MLKVCCGDAGSTSRFSGFRSSDLDGLKAFFKQHYKATLQEQPLATEGWCWGDVVELPGAGGAQGDPDLKVMVNGKVGFDLPVGELKQVNTLAKTDLQLEFKEAAPGNIHADEEWLSEIRFMVPGTGPASLTAEQLKDALQQRAGLSLKGEVLASMREVSLVTPRGKHDFDFFEQAIKIHGKTQTYTLRYDNIQNVFMLELPPHELIVIGLTKPLAQGQSNYYHLVLQWTGQKKVLIPEELPAERLKSMQLHKGEYEMAVSMMARLLKEFTQKMIIGASKEFLALNPSKEKGVRCTCKATPGTLFFNNKSLLFVTKPVVYIKYGDISHIAFQSGKQRGRSFDLEVILRGGGVHEFGQIESTSKEAVFRFLSDHAKVAIENKKEVESGLAVVQGRAEGRRGIVASLKATDLPGAADDDDEEADGDFDGGSAEESGGSSDSSQEDFDGEAAEPEAKRARR